LDRDLDAVTSDARLEAFEGGPAIVAIFDHVELASEGVGAKGCWVPRQGRGGSASGFTDTAGGGGGVGGGGGAWFGWGGGWGWRGCGKGGGHGGAGVADVEVTTWGDTQADRSSGLYAMRLPVRTYGGPSPETR